MTCVSVKVRVIEIYNIRLIHYLTVNLTFIYIAKSQKISGTVFLGFNSKNELKYLPNSALAFNMGQLKKNGIVQIRGYLT